MPVGNDDTANNLMMSPPVRSPWLPSEGQLLRLLIDQEHVTMQSSAQWWSTSHELGQVLSTGHIVSGNIHHDPVFEFTISRFDAGRSVRICHDQSVVLLWISGE